MVIQSSSERPPQQITATTASASRSATACGLYEEGSAAKRRRKAAVGCAEDGDTPTAGEQEVELLFLRYSAEQNAVALYRASLLPSAGRPGPAGPVDASFTSLRITTNAIDGNLPKRVEEDGNCSDALETPYVLIESMKGIIATYNMKALVSVGDGWEQAFDDWVGEVHPQYTEPGALKS